jgi:hypothetical protein
MYRKFLGALANSAVVTQLSGLTLVASVALLAISGGQALASSCSGSVTFAGSGTSTEGAGTFPGTSVGTVGCGSTDVGQIGNITLYNSGSGGAFVNGSHNPVNYEFYFAGGSDLTVTAQIGNNGIGDAIDMELLSWNGTTATLLNSIHIPFSSGPSLTYTLDSADPLGAGDYIISTFLAVGNVTDPNYQVNFSLSQLTGAGPGETPIPGALSLFASGLGGLGLLGWRRKRKAAISA